MPRKLTQLVWLVVFCSAIFGISNLNAQDIPGRKAPSINMVDPGITTAIRGKAANIDLFFRVSQGFHVNSNKPRSEYLIPTTLRLTALLLLPRVRRPLGRASRLASYCRVETPARSCCIIRALSGSRSRNCATEGKVASPPLVVCHAVSFPARRCCGMVVGPRRLKPS